MKNSGKWIALILSVILVLALAGCHRSDEEVTDTNSTSVVEEVVTSETTEATSQTAKSEATTAQQQTTAKAKTTATKAAVTNLSGSWQDEISQRASMDVTKQKNGSYKIVVHWGNSAFETSVWEINGTFDESTGTLSYKNGTYYVWSTDENGNETIQDKQTTSGSFQKEGNKLRWNDSKASGSALFVK